MGPSPFSKFLTSTLKGNIMNMQFEKNEYAASIARRIEEQMRTPEEFKRPPRVYYHHHNGANFVFDLGGGKVKAVKFINHKYITDDKREMDQLDMVADFPGTFIYTKGDTDAAHIMEQEAEEERNKAINQAAMASSADKGQQFDTRVPIIPVQIAGSQQPHGLTVVGGQQAFTPPNVGTASTMSGTSATDTSQQEAIARARVIAESRAKQQLEDQSK